jgi:peptidoglycan/xylan/chitin deacetylase (PgdA/CDA1 family)
LHAFPILRKLGIPATIFLATGAIDEGPCLWFDRVFQAFRETEQERLHGYGNPSMSCPLNTLQQKLEAQDRVLRFLRSVSDEDKAVWIRALCENLKVEEKIRMPGLMLSWDEVRTMARNGISFGAHTVHHPILSRVASRQVREEVAQSREAIEKEVGISVTSFAYPNGAAGDFDESTKDVLRDAGYRCAVTTIVGTNDSKQDLFELRRGTPWGHDPSMFALRLNYLKWAS